MQFLFVYEHIRRHSEDDEPDQPSQKNNKSNIIKPEKRKKKRVRKRLTGISFVATASVERDVWKSEYPKLSSAMRSHVRRSKSKVNEYKLEAGRDSPPPPPPPETAKVSRGRPFPVICERKSVDLRTTWSCSTLLSTPAVAMGSIVSASTSLRVSIFQIFN